MLGSRPPDANISIAAADLRQPTIARSPVSVSAAGDLACEQLEDGWRRNIAGDEGLANAVRQDQGQRSPPYLLVLAHDAEQGAGVGLLSPNMGDRGWQAESGEVRFHARHAVVADMAQLLGKAKCKADADGDRLAVQQPVGELGPGLERMAECVAEIEQHALARLGLVAGDDSGLATHGNGDGMRQRRGIPGAYRWRVLFEPREILGVAEESVFGGLHVARAQLARRQGG